MQALRAEGVTAGEVEAVRLVAPPLIKRLVGRKAFTGMGINHARLCFQYVGARALMTGQVGLFDFTQSALGDADTLALGARIEVVEDGTDDPAAFTPQIAEARLKDGRQVVVETRALYGSPQDPMRPEDQRAKQEACLAFARLPLALADTLAARVAGMETEAEGGAMAALLKP